MRTFAKFVALLALVFVAACGGGGGGSSDTVTVQLDWTPNTNHIGIYLAQAKGWYKDAGIKVKILPYTDVNPDTVVANGKADIGISFPPNLIFSRAPGSTSSASLPCCRRASPSWLCSTPATSSARGLRWHASTPVSACLSRSRRSRP